MKRLLFSSLTFVILILLCCSCGFLGPQKYNCDADAVESIQIVSLDDYVEGEYRYDYTVLVQIDEVDEFVARLNNLKHSVNWGEPSQMNEGYVVIRIEYKNGDFDLLYPFAQCFNRDGTNQYGFFFFDEGQFNNLISDYTNE
ncbi:MAG: hypothetical protein IIX68_00865 [Clostridia bacterium]|nr:hypothetical protein [Clostridia bacterium]